MAITLKRTGGASTFINILVYGQAGAGKTTLIKTLPNPIILSAESGLLSIADSGLQYIEIDSIDTLKEAYSWLSESDEAKCFESVALDSISEIGEVCLSAAKKTAKDPRQAYGDLSETMGEIIRAFRDLPNRHIYFSAKVEKSQDDMGRSMYAPSMPGSKVGQSLPYFFDEVMALRIERDADGIVQRGLMCDSDGLWQAKDRSGKLSTWEGADLGAIIAKVRGA
jgi:phage nucleotide-binding protein